MSTPISTERAAAAIAEVVAAAGFTAMAKQFVDEPHYRQRIIGFIKPYVARYAGPEKAAEFDDLARVAIPADVRQE